MATRTNFPTRDIKAHIIEKEPGNYFDEEIGIYFEGELPGGGVSQAYVDQQDKATLASAKTYTDNAVKDVSGAKLYDSKGENTDGAVTQKLFTETTDELASGIDGLDNDLDSEVQLDTTVSSNASTVTITKTIGALTTTGSEVDMALPVASETQAGIMNAATYNSVQENAELVQSILHAAVSIPNLPADPTQDQLTTAWKSATSETELINRASIFDSSNNKIWYYYSNVAEWQATNSDGGTVTIEQATNTSLGTVKGSTEVGQASVETDGTLSVNGWDDLNTKLDNATTRVTNLPAQVVYNTSLPEYKEGEVDLTLVVKDLHTGGDASLPLNIMGATNEQAGVMTSEQVTALEANTTGITSLNTNVESLQASVEGKQDTLVSGTNIKTVNGETLLGEGDITIDVPEVDLTDYYTKEQSDENFATKTELADKQDNLISGTNIKTLNGESVLGEGNIEISEPKLYSTTGENTDGAMTQKAVTDLTNTLATTVALSAETTARTEQDTKFQSSITSLEGEVETLTGYTGQNVQLDTTISTEDTDSTVTIVKKQANLNDVENATDTSLPLPVASEAQAGVINPATYQSIQDSAEKIETILGGAVSVADLPATPTNDELTAAWKTASGKEELINGAKIFDSTNNKTWTYYANTNSWTSIDNTNPTIELNNFSNEAAGQIKGDNTTDGKIQAETDGTGSVKGWDTVKTDIANNASSIESINTTIGSLGETYALKTALESAQQEIDDNAADISALEADKQDKLVGTGEGQNIKTINGSSVLGAGDIEIDVPEALTAEEFNALWNA